MTSNIESRGFNAHVGIELKGARGRDYVLELQVRPHHLHEADRIHGGVYLTLLDTVMARASRVGLEHGQYVPTCAMNASFLGSVDDGRIIAKGRVVTRSANTCYVEGEIVTADGKLLARGSATMIAVQKRPS